VRNKATVRLCYGVRGGKTQPKHSAVGGNERGIGVGQGWGARAGPWFCLKKGDRSFDIPPLITAPENQLFGWEGAEKTGKK